MSKKAAAAKPDPKPQTVVNGGKPRRIHRVVDASAPAPPALAPADASERVVELEEVNYVEVDEEPAAAAAEEAPPSGEAPTAEQAKHQYRTNATLVLRHAVKKLGVYDYSVFGVEGVSGALAVLRNALGKMEALKKRGGAGRAKVAPGTIVRLRVKRRAHFEGVLEASDFEKIKVIAANGKKLRVELVSGERVMLDAKDVEVAS
jgi:hypothetical protein